mgnify:CR=1 FL=1
MQLFFHRMAKFLARPRKARHDCSNRHPEFLGNFTVIQAFQSNEQQHLPVLHGERSHRAVEIDGLTLIRFLRRVSPQVPIVMVSGIDRAAEAQEAGATCFLNYDEWLRIGTVMADLLPSSSQTASPFYAAHASNR